MMKAMFLAFVAIAVIAVGAEQVLHRAGFSTQAVTTGPSVRLD